MNFTIASAVNDDGILNSCLLSSPDIGAQTEVLLQRGFSTAGDAYNEAMAKAKGEVIVLIHQDVYLPAGWFEQVAAAIRELELTDPNWGVLGVYGITAEGKYHGHLFCNANQCALGKPITGAMEVGTLDEVVLMIVRRDSGLRFDEGLKGFHLYGTDICLTANERGFEDLCGAGFLHSQREWLWDVSRSRFWSGYLYMRRKWKARLPVRTPCIEIKQALWPTVRSTVWRFCWLKGKESNWRGGCRTRRSFICKWRGSRGVSETKDVSLILDSRSKRDVGLHWGGP